MQALPNRRRAGFTLTELMVVILIIGLLVGMVGPKVMDVFFKTQGDIARIELKTIKEAIDQYCIRNNGKFPETLDVLVMEDDAGYQYLESDEIPTDPWDFPYQYVPPLPGSDDFELYSYGADSAPGGEGDAADIPWNQKAGD